MERGRGEVRQTTINAWPGCVWLLAMIAIVAAGCGSPRKQKLPASISAEIGCVAPEPSPAGRAVGGTPASGAGKSDWPVFQHDGRHSATAAVAGPTTGTLRWTRELEGGIEQAPVTAADGTIYAASNGGVLHALDPATGQDRWTFDGGGRYGSDLSIAPAVLAGGSILWPGPRNMLFALSPAGELRWALPFASPVLSPAIAAANNVVNVNTTDIYVAELNGHLHALQVDEAGAHERWVSDLGTHDTLYGSPAVGTDGTIYATVGNRIVALRDHPSRAEILWHFDIASGSEVSPAVGRNDVVLFGTNDQFEYGIDSAGGLLWRYPRNSLSYSSPAVTDSGLAYFGDHNGFMNVLDSDSGCLVIRYPAGGEVWTAPAIDRDGRVYFGTKAGHILGYQFDGQKLFDIDTGAIVASYPALTADGTLLIGSSNGTLYAIHD